MCLYNEIMIWSLLTILVLPNYVASLQSSRVTKNSINRFADAAIQRIKDNTIKSETEPVPVQGIGPYGEGQFSGLTSIKRRGNAIFNRYNSSVTVPISLGHNTMLWFPCTVIFLGRNVCGSEAAFQFENFDIQLIYNSKLGSDGLPQLKICDIRDPFDRSLLQMGSDGNANPIMTWFGGWFSTFARHRLTSNLQDSLCKAIATNS